MKKKSKKLTESDITSLVGEALLKHKRIKINIKNMNKAFSWSALFQSKTVWFNVIMTVIGYISYLQSVAHFDKYAVLLGSILALGNLILKIWFNTTAIASTPTN